MKFSATDIIMSSARILLIGAAAAGSLAASNSALGAVHGITGGVRNTLHRLDELILGLNTRVRRYQRRALLHFLIVSHSEVVIASLLVPRRQRVPPRAIGLSRKCQQMIRGIIDRSRC